MTKPILDMSLLFTLFPSGVAMILDRFTLQSTVCTQKGMPTV